VKFKEEEIDTIYMVNIHLMRIDPLCCCTAFTAI